MIYWHLLTLTQVCEDLQHRCRVATELGVIQVLVFLLQFWGHLLMPWFLQDALTFLFWVCHVSLKEVKAIFHIHLFICAIFLSWILILIKTNFQDQTSSYQLLSFFIEVFHSLPLISYFIHLQLWVQVITQF